MLRKNFNDSSGVSRCLNFEPKSNITIITKQNNNCLKGKQFYSDLTKEKSMCEKQQQEPHQTSSSNNIRKNMYLSRYQLDYKVPVKNASPSLQQPGKCKCKCDKCCEKSIFYFPNATSKDKQGDLPKKSSRTNSRNSLINCVKNLKIDEKVNDDQHKMNSTNKVHIKKKKKLKPTLNRESSRRSSHSDGTFNKEIHTNEPTEFHSKSSLKHAQLGPPVSHGAFKSDDFAKKKAKYHPTFLGDLCKSTNSKENKTMRVEALPSEESSTSELNQNAHSDESKTTVYSIKGHLMDSTKFDKLNRDYDVENYFCKRQNKNQTHTHTQQQQKLKSVNAIEEVDLEKECSNSKIFKPRVVRHLDRKKREIPLKCPEKHEQHTVPSHTKKAYLVEDIKSRYNEKSVQSRGVCPSGNVCPHISLVCDKCVEKINLKNFKLYRCDLINDVLVK